METIKTTSFISITQLTFTELLKIAVLQVPNMLFTMIILISQIQCTSVTSIDGDYSDEILDIEHLYWTAVINKLQNAERFMTLTLPCKL